MSILNNIRMISLAVLFAAVSNGVSAKLLNADLNSIEFKNDMASTIASVSNNQAQWFSYQVEMEPNNGMPCCLIDNNARACTLGKRANSWTSGADDHGDSKMLEIYFKANGKTPSELIYAGSECGVDADNQKVYSINGVTQEQGVSFLGNLVRTNNSEKQTEQHEHLAVKALAGIAMHAGQQAQTMLEQYTVDVNKELRHESIFWLGQSRNKSGYKALIDIVDDETRIKQNRINAIFALSVNSYPSASESLVDYGKNHRDQHIQSESLFWLAENHKDKASAVIQYVFDNSNKPKVRKKAVFSLAQLETKESWDQLISIAKSSKDRDIQDEAIFWLSQNEAENPVPVLLGLIKAENPRSIKDKAIFSLSQLPAGRSTPALLSLIKTSPEKFVRKKALFWLGQSEDPRAFEFLQQVLSAS